MIRKFKEIVKTRWNFLLVGYAFGYAVPLLMEGVPNIYYLIPIKAFAVSAGWLLGNAAYRGLHGGPSLLSSAKITFSAVILGAVAYGLVAIVCWILDIDPTPFYGFSGSQ